MAVNNMYKFQKAQTPSSLRVGMLGGVHTLGGCALPPQGKRRKTNLRRNGQVVCGKRTSTKHHLLAHMNNVHKAYRVIDQVE